ncbi:hypothetical protein PSQ39_21470 [Curvibacter sp. HBC28]|uniref:Uncharacterized protein n=1 Tax=Curvibacter microcysteis TaxID=3026419 RepID=A0ABT5MMM5_9BURK|nr:hypothetical protein [Curvibacter sp. HBC28]MDD0817219.1 hypothetical protein [Curvibacter sp. HBC28]
MNDTPEIQTPEYVGPERRRSVRDWQESVERRFADGSETMQRLAEGLAENTESTKRTETNTAELVEMFQAFKGAFRVFDMIGSLAKPLGYIIMCASAIWGAVVLIKTGGGHR